MRSCAFEGTVGKVWKGHESLAFNGLFQPFSVRIGLVLCVNVLWMAFESQVYGSLSGLELGIYPSALVAPERLPEWENTFQLVDLGFTFIFVLDVVVRIGVLRRRFWMVCMNYLDLAVCGASLVEITLFHALSFPVNPVLFRLFRIGKLARAFRMVPEPDSVTQ